MFATIYLPNFYLQAATRHQPELLAKPVALIETQDRKVIIAQLNKNAEAAGVRIGMTPSQGLARLLSLIIKTRALEQEKVVSELLLQYAFTLSPNLEATAPGICTVEFTDCRDLLSKVSRVVEQLAASQIDAQAAIAPSPDTSLLGAHLARPVLEIDNAKDFLAPLPIETLTISDG
jgi:impB/mucB/samB family